MLHGPSPVRTTALRFECRVPNTKDIQLQTKSIEQESEKKRGRGREREWNAREYVMFRRVLPVVVFFYTDRENKKIIKVFVSG